MKNIYKAIILGFTSIMMLGSCGEDFLYKEPQGSLSLEKLQNATGVDLLTTNAYAGLLSIPEGYEPYQAGVFNWVFGGMYGGDANKGSDPGDQSVLNEIELYNTMPTNGYLSSKWGWMYMAVKRANIALQSWTGAEDMVEEVRQSRYGELKFLRALFYFEGVRVFGPNVPWIDETRTENNPKAYNNENIYDKILADLKEAVDNLPETQGSDIARANKWAAMALQAKVLIYKGEYAAAKEILKKVIEQGVTAGGLKYELEDNLNNNFNALTENGKEAIFSVQFGTERDTGNATFALNYPHNTGPGGCCGFYQPSFELVNSFQVDENGLPYLDNEYRSKNSVSVKGGEGEDVGINDNTIPVDPRLDFAVGRYGIPYKDWGLPKNDWVRNPTNGGIFLPKKHVFSEAEANAELTTDYDGWAPGSAMNMQYLSLRDMMLLYAECLAIDGELSAAMELVNQIRERAALDVNIVKFDDGTPAANYKISTYPSSHAAFSNKEVCMKAIRMERKLELAMEGERWFDLTRWGGDYMSQELKAYIDYERNYIPKFAAASVLSPARTMLPVPDNEILTMGSDESGKPYLVQPDAWK
ncbi:MAG: RagB/SusD family nutrient uptake outer membrane protein [Tannerellaceae bacterium]|nr:RagB/SusD family nutrient uptake outer membrane protein [Tannerellaceae bacterium]